MLIATEGGAKETSGACGKSGLMPLPDSRALIIQNSSLA
jgi:hypothetical protein